MKLSELEEVMRAGRVGEEDCSTAGDGSGFPPARE
jgi:hypothetical protein